MGKALLPTHLHWLADVPLFIDAGQLAQFHDAVVRPEHREGATTLEITNDVITALSGELGLAGEVEPTDLLEKLSTFLPFLKVKIAAEGKGQVNRQKEKRDSRTIELRPIETPQRQLEHLVLHYLFNHRERLFLVDEPSSIEWREPETILRVPRAMVFLDLPGQQHDGGSHTKVIPTAAEFADGQVELIFERLCRKDGQRPPSYPEQRTSEKSLRELRQEYWQWFDENYSPTQAMIAVEEAASRHGRILWIDYRLPLNAEGETLHLHVCPGGHYNTGTFAYNLIKRGYKHGLRIIGTLKSEPDLNVLAVYEK
jgi:hypothetical protein